MFFLARFFLGSSKSPPRFFKPCVFFFLVVTVSRFGGAWVGMGWWIFVRLEGGAREGIGTRGSGKERRRGGRGKSLVFVLGP